MYSVLMRRRMKEGRAALYASHVSHMHCQRCIKLNATRSARRAESGYGVDLPHNHEENISDCKHMHVRRQALTVTPSVDQAVP